MDVLGGKTFDKLGYGSTSVPMDQFSGNLGEMLVGDWGFFQNYDDYGAKMEQLNIPLPPYQGENFIKLGDDAYRGLPNEGTRTETQWDEALRNAYNKPRGVPEGLQRTEKTPGFDNFIKFIDVATVASDSFRLRRK